MTMISAGFPLDVSPQRHVNEISAWIDGDGAPPISDALAGQIARTYPQFALIGALGRGEPVDRNMFIREAKILHRTLLMNGQFTTAKSDYVAALIDWATVAPSV